MVAKCVGGSCKGKLNKTDWPAIERGFFYGALLHLLMFLSEYAVNADFGELDKAVATIVPPICAFVIRWLKNNEVEEVKSNG